jgi:hypothetical protein
MFKLSGWVWILCGVFVGLTLLSYGYFQYYQPDTAEAAQLQTYAEQLEAEARKIPQTEKRMENAKLRVQETADQWRMIEQNKSAGGAGFIDLTQDPLALTVNAPSYRDKVQRAVNSQVKAGGVTVVNGPEIPAPSNDPTTLLNTYFNYSSLFYPVVLFEPGSVTVRGTFDQIARNVTAWSNMKDYFAVVDGLTITGTSPELTATYNLVLLGYIPGGVSGPLGQPIVTGPAGTAASAGGGGGGGGSFGGGGGGGGGAALSSR